MKGKNRKYVRDVGHMVQALWPLFWYFDELSEPFWEAKISPKVYQIFTFDF